MNKKVVLAILSVVIIVSALAVSFFGSHQSGGMEKNIDIYFLNDKDSSLATENRTVKYDNPDELLRLVTENILKGPSGGKLHAVAGKGTKILGIEQYESNLTVDFSKEFLRENTATNMLSVYAIVKTLCQIDKVMSVKVTVEGKPVVAADGNEMSFIANRDINLETDMFTTDSKNITLYFASKDGTKLEKEVRTIKITDTRPIESYVINELIKGPVNKDLSATLAAETELVTAETNNGTCHVTFKNFIEKNMQDPANTKSMLAVYSVVNSLTALEDVSSVRFLFEGKTAEMVGTFNFAEVFSENKALEK